MRQEGRSGGLKSDNGVRKGTKQQESVCGKAGTLVYQAGRAGRQAGKLTGKKVRTIIRSLKCSQTRGPRASLATET